MTDKTFQVDIISPQNVVFSGQAASLAVPGELGSIGILANHAPLISSLKPGEILLREPSGQILKYYSQANGFVEVLKNQVKVLVDKAEKR